MKYSENPYRCVILRARLSDLKAALYIPAAVHHKHDLKHLRYGYQQQPPAKGSRHCYPCFSAPSMRPAAVKIFFRPREQHTRQGGSPREIPARRSAHRHRQQHQDWRAALVWTSHSLKTASELKTGC
jgi:hypothetical protein